ncbi:hypothetical protein [Corynebacterium pacaense]|uniref:hypothetical protein n=1 Tax=Corynebacterium pacaense TaxID=1816684 RepID=UPI0011787FF0|nr:hypothetical protein [Corynebacterium pacaense]
MPGEFLLTSLEFGRVVIESELKESNVCVYSGDTHSRNWNSDHSIPLSLDHAREYWSAEESATYCASAFRECRDVLDAEYPGGADQAEWELELWFG